MPAAPSYDLPEAAIAQVPAEPRDSARLLVDEGPGRPPRHLTVTDLPSLVRSGDVLVLNETRVLPARLRFTRATGGAAEVLLLEPEDGDLCWSALVRPSRKIPPGTVLRAGDDLAVEVGEVREDGIRRVRLLTADLDAALARHGEVPLPPYLREGLADPGRYQTVYATRPGSVAAPTAGLHLTTEVLDRCRAAGAEVHRLDLTVGMGTFKPVTAERLEDHEVHEEPYAVPAGTLAACEAADRVVAIGTTTVRALETAAATGRLTGRTNLLVHGDHQWRVVDALVTNFHMPHSTLLLLIESFIGPRWRDLYATALDEGYRFLSFGDAMFLGADPMTVTTVRFRPDDLGGILAVLDPAGWVNLRPEVDEELGVDTEISRSWVASIFSNKGPGVPLATWHAGERAAGIQHSSGPRVVRRLEVPPGWRKVQDHPRRGLVLRVPMGVPDDEVLHWLVAAASSVATVPLLGGWVAEVHAP